MTETAHQGRATPLLSAKSLACRRGDRLLFSDLDVTLLPGELLQVMGPNGCGKTSLLRILCGLRAPDTGAVLWRGQDIAEQREDFQQELALVGHRPGIKDDLTPAENLRVSGALGGASTGMSIEDALRRVGLLAHTFDPCGQLSSGQRRRTALARLLLTPASLWVLDEPLTGLDRQGQSLVESLMYEQAERGGACVFTTHQTLPGGAGRLRVLELSR